MKHILLSLILLASLPCSAQSRGLSFIGLCHESVKAADLETVFRGVEVLSLHLLSRSFNPQGCPSFEMFSKDPRPLVLHISLMNGAGLRNKRLARHEWLFGETIRSADTKIRLNKRSIIKQIKASAREANKLIALRENRPTVIRIKPILESDFSRPARRIVFRYVSQILPKIELIDNPVRGRCLLGYLCETHGLDVRGDIVDLDGVSADEIDLATWTAETAEKVGRFIWIRCNNGLARDVPWSSPLNRANWCSEEKLAFLNRWLLEQDGR